MSRTFDFRKKQFQNEFKVRMTSRAFSCESQNLLPLSLTAMPFDWLLAFSQCFESVTDLWILEISRYYYDSISTNVLIRFNQAKGKRCVIMRSRERKSAVGRNKKKGKRSIRVFIPYNSIWFDLIRFDSTLFHFKLFLSLSLLLTCSGATFICVYIFFKIKNWT